MDPITGVIGNTKIFECMFWQGATHGMTRSHKSEHEEISSPNCATSPERDSAVDIHYVAPANTDQSSACPSSKLVLP